MTKLRYLSVLLSQRLTLAAQEIFKDVEETISELQEEVKLVKLENAKLKTKLREAGSNSSNELTPDNHGELQNCGEQRPEVALEDTSIIASLKQELDAQGENDGGSMDSEKRECVAMQIKMETDFTECSPNRDQSAGQTDPRVTVSIAVGSLPVSDSRAPVFPCVERTWSVRDSVAKETEPQASQTQERSDDILEDDGRPENVPESSNTDTTTQTTCNWNANCPPVNDDNEDDYDVFDDHDGVEEDGDRGGDDHVMDPVKESDNMDVEMPHKPQMPQKRLGPRTELSKGGNSYSENGCEEINLDKETSSENITMVRTGKPRGRPRKHPQTSTPKPESRNSQRWLRSGNDRTEVRGGLQKRHKTDQTSTNNSVEVNEESRIGRPTRRSRRNLEDDENIVVPVLNTVVTTKNPRGRPRKNPQTTIVKSAEMDQKDSVSEKSPISEGIKDMSRPHRRSGRLRDRSEIRSEDEESISVQEANSKVSTVRPRGRPRKNPQSTIVKPSKVGLDHDESVSEEPPVSEDNKDASTIQSIQMDHQDAYSNDEASTHDRDSSVLGRSGRVPEGRSTGKLKISKTKASDVNLEGEENCLGRESNPRDGAERPRGTPKKDPQTTSDKPVEVDLDQEDSVSEELPISEGDKDLSRPNRRSGRLRKCTNNSPTQPDEMDHQNDSSSDEASSGDDGDLSLLGRSNRTPMKRPRSSSSEYEVDMEQDGDSSDSSCEEALSDSTRKERPRKHHRISNITAVEEGLDHVSVLNKEMGLVKRQYCLYCTKPVSKLSRHLAMRHYNERDVIKALTLPKHSKERKTEMALLRNRGNSAHNHQVLKEGKGLLIPCRVFKSQDPKDVLTCPGCSGMFSKEYMSRHIRCCTFITTEDDSDLNAAGDQSSRTVTRQAPDFAEVLSGMYQDDVAEAVRGDKNILKLGQLMCDRKNANEYIWQRLRELGRVLLNGRKITPLYQIEDYIRLENWDHLAAVVKDVALYSETTCTFAIPKYAVNIRRSLDTIAGILKCEAEANGDREMVVIAQTFQENLKMRWHQKFMAPEKPNGNSPLLVLAEQTSHGRNDQQNASENNINAAQSKTEHEMLVKNDSAVPVLPASHEDEAQNILESTIEQTSHGRDQETGREDDINAAQSETEHKTVKQNVHSVVPVSPTSQEDEVQNTLESTTEEPLERSDDRQRDGDADDDDDYDDDDKEDNDNNDDGDEDYDVAEDDSSHDDDGDDDDGDEDCGDSNVTAVGLENKSNTAEDGDLNEPCDSAQNDTPTKPLKQLQPCKISTAGVSMSSVNNHRDRVSDQKNAPKKSGASNNDAKVVSILQSTKRIKKNHCLFCKRLVSKISRHLEQRHYEQDDVAKAFSYPKGSKERKIYLKQLLRRGNRAHNLQVLKEGKGVLIPCKRAVGKPGDFLHCPYCHGLFVKRSIGVHLRQCPFATNANLAIPKKGKRGRVAALCLMAEPIPENVTEELWKVLGNMHQNDVSMAVRTDKYALQLGQELLDKGKGREAIKEIYIRQRLRELGRLLMSARKITPMYKLEDFILPSNWHHVVAVLKDVSEYSEEVSTFKLSILQHFYRNLQKIGRFVELDAESRQDEQMLESARTFNWKFVEKWRRHFPTPFAARKIQQGQSDTNDTNGMNDTNDTNGTRLLSFTEDIRHLHTYLKDKLTECVSVLWTSPGPAIWNSLARIVLAQLVMFNRKKANEIAGLTLKDFNTKEAYGMPCDEEEDLTPFERELCKFTCRMEISRATGDNIQILVPPALANIMETMLQKRRLCRIRCDNIYMFALPSIKTHYLGVECLKSLAENCGVKCTEALVSNGLRMHVAMVTQLLYLKDMPQLTEFMGLNLTAYLKNDCLQQDTLELAKLSKVFTALENGHLKVTEQTVDEVIVSPDEIVQPDYWSSSEEHDEDDDDYHPSKSAKAQSANTRRRSVTKHNRSAAEGQAVERRVLPAIARRRSVTKHKWSEAEVQAVERHMAKFISSGTTPGKKACTACIMAEPVALKDRQWAAIKYYIRNRITTLRRLKSKPPQ
ncbi:uncharacterized protein LOC125303674 isoform X2 [Alosa alosa]|uniref:uncharacterized protein LOC125303674 isoform X2 n=1 Tax=Alosa alosa TaxID=278164 RepID=UPI0020150EA2|nr:uncharacterized protein LOC125303674 isoform X2 [Alosa alosa]